MADVYLAETFEKQAKKLIKKYHSLPQEITELIESLEQNPIQGKALGKDCYKIRLSIASKNKGKSGGARVITLFKMVEDMVVLLSIYDKSVQENISYEDISSLLETYEDE
jgi:hypothetical protein